MALNAAIVQGMLEKALPLLHEVRKLAEESQIAATEINMLSSTTNVAAERANEVILTVIPGIEQTAGLVEKNSLASKEQDIGAQQVNKALVQMDIGVQQNASSSEELASMTEESDQNPASSHKLTQSTATIPKHEVKTEKQKPPSKATSSNGIGTQSYTSTFSTNDFEEF